MINYSKDLINAIILIKFNIPLLNCTLFKNHVINTQNKFILKKAFELWRYEYFFLKYFSKKNKELLYQYRH